MTSTIFYGLPADLLCVGLSTDDSQDIIAVTMHGKSVSAMVYTPRSDDPDADEENRSMPETRVYDVGEVVDLAVFSDTPVDGSEHPRAIRRIR